MLKSPERPPTWRELTELGRAQLGSVASEGITSQAGVPEGAAPEDIASEELELLEIEEGEIIDRDRPQSLTDHLAELRQRLLISIFFWLGASALAYTQVGRFLESLRRLAGGKFTFVYTSPTEAFMAFLKLALLGGLVLTLPLLLYQFLAFINPGLKRKERRLLYWLVPAGSLLFGVGVIFAWRIALPLTWRFLLSFQGPGLEALWTIGEVVGFSATLLFICGAAFELPLLLVGLAYLGLVSYRTLSGSRRLVYFAILAGVAILTPTPDAFTCLVIALPGILLFEISLLVIYLVERSRSQAARK